MGKLFWYKGGKNEVFKPWIDCREIRRGRNKGRLEVTFKVYGVLKKTIVDPSQVWGREDCKDETDG